VPGIVAIDCFPESAQNYRNGYALVAIDVIRATTTAVTAVARGRRCFPVPSIEAAVPLAARLTNPLLVGELGGNMPFGFHVNNSPAELHDRPDLRRPMILLSTSGTRLIWAGAESQAVYVACLRNYSAQAAYLAAHHQAVAIIGAGARGDFREEDQLGCAWIAQQLLDAGFEPLNDATAALVERWRGQPVERVGTGASGDYLRLSGQERDLEFILNHVDDVNQVFRFQRGEIVSVAAEPAIRSPRPAALTARGPHQDG
jgi:2-phosphosulfolactate phosphatase